MHGLVKTRYNVDRLTTNAHDTPCDVQGLLATFQPGGPQRYSVQPKATTREQEYSWGRSFLPAMSPRTIANRRLISFCPTFDGKTPSELVLTCEGCGFYFLACCRNLASKKGNPYTPCHHDPIVFVDGACSNNGSIDVQVVAGIGIATGIPDEARSSIPIHHAMDPSGRRTSQRAELLAAIHGLRRALDLEAVSEQGHPPQSGDSLENVIVIAADSEYVVKGMTEWYTS
jgi:ribonuclease HI